MTISNCVIEALKRKFKDWTNIRLVPLWKGWHFHMMWYDRKRGKFRHFTHRRLDGWFTTILFKGTVENVKRKHLEKWCRSVGIELKV